MHSEDIFAALKHLRPGVSFKRSWFPVRQWESCLGARPLSLRHGSGEQMSNQTCIGLRGLQKGHQLGAASMHPPQPRLSPLRLLPLLPQLCPGFPLLSTAKYRNAIATEQPVPEALRWQRWLPISLSDLNWLKEVFSASAGWAGSSFRKMGMPAHIQGAEVL